ncbi:MAG TPA: hypothetical protein VG164_01710 [Trebonia sp.]|nr:hypothetical protein [Trebonia sp.]
MFGAVTGAGMAAAFGPLMTRVLSRVPVAIAADASGVIVTLNQLGIVEGIATFGTLVRARLPVHVVGAGRAGAGRRRARRGASAGVVAAGGSAVGCRA